MNYDRDAQMQTYASDDAGTIPPHSKPIVTHGITEAQGKLIIALIAKQLDLLESIERSLVILNRKMP